MYDLYWNVTVALKTLETFDAIGRIASDEDVNNYTYTIVYYNKLVSMEHRRSHNSRSRKRQGKADREFPIATDAKIIRLAAAWKLKLDASVIN